MVALSLTVLMATTASAAPGDARLVQGTLLWPAALGDERFIVVKGTDGSSYYADVTIAKRLTQDPVKAGDPVSFVGFEGSKSHEITALAVGPRDSAVAAFSRPLPGVTTLATPAETSEPDWQRLDGWVESNTGKTLVMRLRNGQSITMDISHLNRPTWLKAGQEVTVFGHPRPGGGVAVAGFIQRETSGSALPRSAR
jgi:hypothetical protein